MEISLPTDEDGFLSQQCPTCERNFKVRFGEGAEEPISHCPYCGFEGSECWWTDQQAEYLSGVATAEILGPELKRAARKMSSTRGLFDIHAEVTLPDIPARPQEVDDPGFNILTFPCCNETIKYDGEADQLNCILCGESVEVMMERADKVFLSHKGCDKPKVREFKETLELLGFRPWLDEDAMTAGVELERGISQGFKDSCAVVFFVTPSFKDEKYLATEVNYTIREKRSKGDHFQIITLCLHGDNGDKGQVPALLQPYVWKTPKSDLEALQEILRALPISVGAIKWKDDGASTTTGESKSNISKKNKQLSKESTELLNEAVAGDGTIIALHTSGGFHIQAARREFGDQGDPRSEATWQAALDELVRRGYIRDRGHKSEVFGVTKEGYEYADSAIAQNDVTKIILDLSEAEVAYLMTLSRPRNQEGILSDSFDSFSGREGEAYYAMIERFVELDLMRYAGSLYKITEKGYKVTDRLWQNLLLQGIQDLSSESEGSATLDGITAQAKLTDGELEAKECQRLLDSLEEQQCIERHTSEQGDHFQALARAEVLQRPLKDVSYEQLD